jgi:hypothetical protein
MAGLLTDIAIKWKLRSLAPAAGEVPPAWEKIKKVALVIAASPRLSKNEIDNFIAQLGKYVEVFYVEARSSTASFSDWHCLTRRDFSLLKLPKQKVIAELRKKDFDLVINSSPPDDSSSVLVAAAIPARLHCSGSHRYHDARLVITQGETKTLVEYLTQVAHYLQMIRPGK